MSKLGTKIPEEPQFEQLLKELFKIVEKVNATIPISLYQFRHRLVLHLLYSGPNFNYIADLTRHDIS